MTAGEIPSSVLGRIVRPADYARVLATPMRLRSTHFAVHHLDDRPLPTFNPAAHAVEPTGPAARPDAASAPIGAPDTASLSPELSTGLYTVPGGGVDDLCSAAKSSAGSQRWLGLVVPKRHARRAVTRTLIKRQIRTVVAEAAAQLPAGLWVVRQRAPFDPGQFPSAASESLKVAARTELRGLFERAVRDERDHFKPRPPRAEGSAPSKGTKQGKTPGKSGGSSGASATPSAPEPGNACAR